MFRDCGGSLHGVWDCSNVVVEVWEACLGIGAWKAALGQYMMRPLGLVPTLRGCHLGTLFNMPSTQATRGFEHYEPLPTLGPWCINNHFDADHPQKRTLINIRSWNFIVVTRSFGLNEVSCPIGRLMAWWAFCIYSSICDGVEPWLSSLLASLARALA